MIVYHDQHNHPKINNLTRVENHRIRIIEVDRSIDLNFFRQSRKKSEKFASYRECHLKIEEKQTIVNDSCCAIQHFQCYVPQIFRGASSSSKMG